MNSRTVTDSKPWYRQFWPWFLIALPGSVVIAGISMVVVAFRHADTLVVDDYYQDGLAINQILEKDQRAAQLNLRAGLVFDFQQHELRLQLSGDAPPPSALQLLLLHPTDKSRDATVLLSSIGGGKFAGQLPDHFAHRYYLRLEPAQALGKSDAGDGWRLNGELDFGISQQVLLSADD